MKAALKARFWLMDFKYAAVRSINLSEQHLQASGASVGGWIWDPLPTVPEVIEAIPMRNILSPARVCLCHIILHPDLFGLSCNQLLIYSQPERDPSADQQPPVQIGLLPVACALTACVV